MAKLNKDSIIARMSSDKLVYNAEEILNNEINYSNQRNFTSGYMSILDKSVLPNLNSEDKATYIEARNLLLQAEKNSNLMQDILYKLVNAKNISELKAASDEYTKFYSKDYATTLENYIKITDDFKKIIDKYKDKEPLKNELRQNRISSIAKSANDDNQIMVSIDDIVAAHQRATRHSMPLDEFIHGLSKHSVSNKADINIDEAIKATISEKEQRFSKLEEEIHNPKNASKVDKLLEEQQNLKKDISYLRDNENKGKFKTKFADEFENFCNNKAYIDKVISNKEQSFARLEEEIHDPKNASKVDKLLEEQQDLKRDINYLRDNKNKDEFINFRQAALEIFKDTSEKITSRQHQINKVNLSHNTSRTSITKRKSLSDRFSQVSSGLSNAAIKAVKASGEITKQASSSFTKNFNDKKMKAESLIKKATKETKKIDRKIKNKKSNKPMN